jgi:hypothetical protein
LVVGCASLSALSRRGEAVEAKAYSVDMRQRVIDQVESGASRRGAAEHYEVCGDALTLKRDEIVMIDNLLAQRKLASSPTRLLCR